MDKEVKARLERHYLIIIIELCMMLGACIYLKLYDKIVDFCMAIIGFIITYILLKLQR
ncbi:hypothetical protein [Methanothermococcus sp.]|uniref:hypothetical protein n=1 Tax=Methanothermococcus sp. TaxID=2614238 RepID=UPI0025F39CEB|nr:hypothetical protein [Methanothermococcus sp.]